MNSCGLTRNISLAPDELKGRRWSRGKGNRGQGEVTFLDFGLLHLILEVLLEFSFVVVGELGEVELGGGGGGEIHGWVDVSRLNDGGIRKD